MADTTRPIRQQAGAVAQQPASAAEPADAGMRRRAGVWQRFRRHRVAVAGAVILLVLAVTAIGAPIFAQNDPYKVDISAYRQGPQARYPLGTDSSGRDVLSR